MRPGLMRHRIEIQSATIAENDLGEEEETWAELKTVWASYEPKSAGEKYAEDQFQAKRVVLFRIRYREGITTKMRVVHDGLTYDIDAVIPYKFRGELHLECEARD